MAKVVAVLFLLVLASCAGSREPPLAVIHADDPTWELRPDHLENGELPR